MKNLGYYNGKYDELEKMTVPMLDRACYFGDGVYDATYCRNYVIYALDEHIDRFYASAALLDIHIPHTKEELKGILCELVKKLDDGSQFVYIQASRGTGLRNHAYEEGGKANIWIMLKPQAPKDTYRRAKLITLEDRRFLYCNIKTLNLIPSVLYTEAAVKAGCDEAVLHRGDRVTECAHSNVSILKDGVLKTAPADEYILAGVARAHLIEMCRRFGVPVEEVPFTVSEMMGADEVIVTSSSLVCFAAEEIDGKPVGGRAPALLRQLQDALVKDFLEKTSL